MKLVGFGKKKNILQFINGTKLTLSTLSPCTPRHCLITSFKASHPA